MKIQGIIVNSVSQQEVGSNIKVLKIAHSEEVIDFLITPVATIIENTTGELFDVDYTFGLVKITHTDPNYFNINNYWFNASYVTNADNENTVAIPNTRPLTFTGTNGSLYIIPALIDGTVTVFIL